ncbi:MAG: hypothetical protein K6E12_01020 [Saccharofermentans sp.]|nr:hypothetical protein [Saccharofermentans sp.]
MKSFKVLGRTLILSLVTGAVLLTSCSEFRHKEPEQVVTLYNDSVIVEHYMNALDEWDHAIYEEVYFDWGSRSIGPTEYRYRGVVYLTDEEAARLWEEYDWAETDAPEFEFDKVDTDCLGSGPWYKCNGFNSDNYSTIVANYTVFDGEKLVFDIHQI